MSATVPDALTIQQADGRYIPKRTGPAGGSDDAAEVSVDTSAMLNVTGSNVKAALESAASAVLSVAGSAAAGAFPTLANWKPRSILLDTTAPAFKRLFNFSPLSSHVYEVISYDTSKKGVFYCNVDMPTGFDIVPTAIDIIYTTPAIPGGASPGTDIGIEIATISDTDDLDISYAVPSGVSSPIKLTPPAGAMDRKRHTINLNSPFNVVAGDTVSFKFTFDPLFTNQSMTVFVVGIVWRRV